MKSKQRILAVVLLCSALVIMGVIQCFAFEFNPYTIPEDLGEEVTTTTFENGFYYIYIPANYSGNSTLLQMGANAYASLAIQKNGDNIAFKTSTISDSNKDYVSDVLSYYDVKDYYGKAYYNTQDKYVLICIAYKNGNITLYGKENGIKIYRVKTINNSELEYAYLEGYTQGYNIGLDDGIIAGQGLKQDLNIVQHIEQLIAQFTGNEYAKYITPIALVLTILMIYFLFIRFILSLMKAKGVIKTCDILMIVACIIILVAMYMPMINLEITQHQIIEQVETTSSDVYTVNSDVTYYTYTDDQGNTIHGGPVGTWIETVEETSP